MVTEHQAEIKVCSCCNKRVVATFPYGVNAPVQYGEVIQSWAVYFQHQQFIPDHLRELKALIDYNKESWVIKMRRFLRFGLHCRHVYENKLIPDETLKRLTHLYPKIIAEGIAFHEGLPAFSEKNGRGRKARRTGHNLVLRLKNYCDDVLRFLFDPLVPFTNNQAERDIRMMKCKQKISGGFRSEKGAKIFARIRGFISTARKQGWNIFDSIQRVVRGSVPMPI